MVTLNGKARFRMNFSIHHMLAAVEFARRSGVIEEEHRGEPLGSFYDEIVIHASSAIIMAVASSEAYINEVFGSPEESFPGQDMALVEEIWVLVNQQSIIQKYQIALSLRSKPRMPEGNDPCQGMNIRIRMRNALVHFKPEWSDEADEHRTLHAQPLLPGRRRWDDIPRALYDIRLRAMGRINRKPLHRFLLRNFRHRKPVR